MDELLLLQQDNKLYFRTALKIKDKNAEILTFVTNDSQNELLAIIEGHYKKYPNPKTRPTLYIIILKARQQGMSTATEGVFFKAITIGMPGDTPFNKNAMVISYDEDSAQVINEMSDRFYQYLPQEIKPMKRNSRGKGLILENPTNVQAEFEKNPGLQSKFLIETAKNLYAGSSFTLNYLHISELSKWDKPSETMKSLMQSVPKHNAIVIVESTANGAGDYFHKLWQQAETGENDYVPLFLSWLTHKEYSDPFEIEEERQHLITTLDDEEKQLIKLHNATLEQLNWRRKTIKNKCEGSVDVFHQEYPTTAEEAFLTSGRPRFDIPALREYLKQCVDGEKGYLENKKGTVKFNPDAKGYVEVWQRPQPGKEYFIGGDVAKGLVEGDYSAAPVYDANYNMVALWHGHIDPDLFGDELDALGRWYNEALIVPEENNHGLTTINRLKVLGYWNIYKRTTLDKATDTEKQELGWYTSEQTKRYAVDYLAKLIRERRLGTKSRRFVSECTTYVRDDKGATNAQPGCFDDTVTGSAIVLAVMEQYVTEIPDILKPSGEKKSAGDNWVRRSNGTMVHRSEIEDAQSEDVGDWAKGWFN